MSNGLLSFRAPATATILGVTCVGIPMAAAVVLGYSGRKAQEKKQTFADSVAAIMSPALNQIQVMAADNDEFKKGLETFNEQFPLARLVREKTRENDLSILTTSVPYKDELVIIDQRQFIPR